MTAVHSKAVVLLFIVTPIVEVCNCSMFCCTLLYVHSSIAIILMGKRELIALLNLSSWCLTMVERLFLMVPRGCLRFVIVVFPDHTHYFYGDLVYKLKKIVGSNNFSVQFNKIISHYKKFGYDINVLQQTACLVVNPIRVGNFAFLFNCTPVGRTSDSMRVRTLRLIY